MYILHQQLLIALAIAGVALGELPTFSQYVANFSGVTTFHGWWLLEERLRYA